MAALGHRSVNGRRRGPTPAQRIIPFTRALCQRRNVARGDLAQVGEIGLSLERAGGVAQRGGNGDQEVRIPLHPVDVLEPGGVLELALNGEQVEELLERLRRYAFAAVP